MSNTLTKIADYCKENIDNYETRLTLALDKIAYWRASLDYVDNSLYSEMMDTIAEYGEEYEVDVEEIDAEDLIWL